MPIPTPPPPPARPRRQMPVVACCSPIIDGPAANRVARAFCRGEHYRVEAIRALAWKQCIATWWALWRAREQPVAQIAHRPPDLLKVGRCKTRSERGAFRGQKIIKASSIVGAPLSIDDEAGACLVADIPVDCRLLLDAGWQVELKASALEGDGVAAWQATGTGHVA